MNITLSPILSDLRKLYAISDRFRRFDAYAALGSGKTRGEPLPLGVFSPMGERQPGYLEQLMAIDAEALAQATADDVTADFAVLYDRFRLMLVVADVPRNGWTERHLTDSEWRFARTHNNDRDTLPKSAVHEGPGEWVTVLLWTDTEATATYVIREVRAALYRALYHRYCGPPRTLAEMMQQEGRVLAYAGYVPELAADELEYSQEVIEPDLQSTAWPVCFAALYGDDAARTVGYSALGLAAKAGFQLALHDTLSAETSVSLIEHLQILHRPNTPA